MSNTATAATPAAADERESIYTGHHGAYVADQLKEDVGSNGKAYAKVPFLVEGGKQITIMAFGADLVADVKADLMKPVAVVHGFVEGRGVLHLHETGIRVFEGDVSNVRKGVTEKGPWLNAFLTYTHDGAKHGAPFSAFGEHAARLGGIEDDSSIRLEGHMSREKGNDGNYRGVIHVMEAKVLALTKEKASAKDDSPEP